MELDILIKGCQGDLTFCIVFLPDPACFAWVSMLLERDVFEFLAVPRQRAFVFLCIHAASGKSQGRYLRSCQEPMQPMQALATWPAAPAALPSLLARSLDCWFPPSPLTLSAWLLEAHASPTGHRLCEPQPRHPEGAGGTGRPAHSKSLLCRN